MPPTGEVRQAIAGLEQQHGPVRTIVLPTASGLEHKLPLGPLARAFPDAEIWVCPGQWSFPVQLPLAWLGVPEHVAPRCCSTMAFPTAMFVRGSPLDRSTLAWAVSRKSPVCIARQALCW